jgi:hypothetical protein
MATKGKGWGKTLADMRVGQRNPRVMVVEVNRHMARVLDSIRSAWAISMSTYDVQPSTPGHFANVKWRQRRPDELPENDPQAWERVEEYARALRFSAAELERFARVQGIAARVRAAGTYEKDVHTEHCCKAHGCKYGDGQLCPVESGAKPQSFPCEACDE